jgi:hypothetical protein
MRVRRRAGVSIQSRLLVAITGLSAAAMVPATGAGADPVTALQFGAPTGIACVTTDLVLDAQSESFTSLSNNVADDLPFDAWDGVPLLNLIEGPITGASNYSPLAGYNCGNVAHGASAVTLGASAHQSFADTASGQLGEIETGSVSASSPHSPSGLSSIALGENFQEETATVTPVLSAGDQSFTVTVSYQVLSYTSSSPPEGDSFAGTNLTYLEGATAPSCNGQNIPYDSTGTQTAQQAGTYTVGFTFSCPAGQTLTSGPVTAEFYETQNLRLLAGQSVDTSIDAQVLSATVSAGD